MSKEQYNPTPEEMHSAEEMMTESEKKMSQAREKILELLETSNGGAAVIEGAKKLGVAEGEIKTYAFKVIKKDIQAGYSPETALRMAKNTGIATEEEVKDVVTKTYEQILKKKPSDIIAAEYLYGKNSKEYRKAEELYKDEQDEKKKREKEKKKDKKWKIVKEKGEKIEEVSVSLSSDATLSDLFEAIESEEEAETNLDEVFWSEIYDNFDEEAQRELENLHVDQPELAKRTKVLDFFIERGYSKNDIETYLPIKFK